MYPMVDMDDFLITRGHPIFVRGKWKREKEEGEKEGEEGEGEEERKRRNGMR
jgi:hypothetical protein